MVEINYEKFLSDLVKPLVAHPDEVMVKIFSEEDDVIILQIMVNEEDKGRVIGRNGRIINAIKTIAYASASKSGKSVSSRSTSPLPVSPVVAGVATTSSTSNLIPNTLPTMLST